MTANCKKDNYIGRIKNSGAQKVEAPFKCELTKKGKVKTGNDLRTGK